MGRLDELAGQRARQLFETALAEGAGVGEASRRAGVTERTVLGPPGMGKTHLAHEWMASEAITLGHAEPVYCDLRRAETEGDLVAELKRGLDAPQAGVIA